MFININMFLNFKNIHLNMFLNIYHLIKNIQLHIFNMIYQMYIMYILMDIINILNLHLYNIQLDIQVNNDLIILHVYQDMKQHIFLMNQPLIMYLDTFQHIHNHNHFYNMQDFHHMFLNMFYHLNNNHLNILYNLYLYHHHILHISDYILYMYLYLNIYQLSNNMCIFNHLYYN